MECSRQSISCHIQCVHAEVDHAILAFSCAKYHVLWKQLADLDSYLMSEWRTTPSCSAHEVSGTSGLLGPLVKNALDRGKQELLIHEGANQWLAEWTLGLLSQNIQPLQASLICLCMYVFITSGHKNSACPLNKHDRLISALLYCAPGHGTGFFFLFSFKWSREKVSIRTNWEVTLTWASSGSGTLLCKEYT